MSRYVLFYRILEAIHKDRDKIKHFKKHGEDEIVTAVKQGKLFVDPNGIVYRWTNNIAYHAIIRKLVRKYEGPAGLVMYIPLPQRNYAGVRY